jgi:hypothetical protein
MKKKGEKELQKKHQLLKNQIKHWQEDNYMIQKKEALFSFQ